MKNTIEEMLDDGVMLPYQREPMGMVEVPKDYSPYNEPSFWDESDDERKAKARGRQIGALICIASACLSLWALYVWLT